MADDRELAAARAIASRLRGVDSLVKRAAKEDAAERARLLAARPDLTHGMKSHLASKPLEEVKSLLSCMPVPSRPPGLQGAELDEYNRAAKKRPPITTTHEILPDGSMRMNAITPGEWNKLAKGPR